MYSCFQKLCISFFSDLYFFQLHSYIEMFLFIQLDGVTLLQPQLTEGFVILVPLNKQLALPVCASFYQAELIRVLTSPKIIHSDQCPNACLCFIPQCCFFCSYQMLACQQDKSDVSSSVFFSLSQKREMALNILSEICQTSVGSRMTCNFDSSGQNNKTIKYS